MRVFLMLACGLVAGEFHPQFRRDVLIGQRGSEAVAQGVERAREIIRLPAPFTVCKSKPVFLAMRLKPSESPCRPPGRKFAICGRMNTSALSVPASLFKRASKSG